jgi:hypothetical protein
MFVPSHVLNTLRFAAVPVALALALNSVSASAQITVGSANAATCLPFGCNTGISRYQQVLNASAFGTAPFTIASFSLSHSPQYELGTLAAGSYLIRMGITSYSAQTLSGNLDQNASAGLADFAQFSIAEGTAAPSMFTIFGANSFLFDPAQGNLLLDIVPTLLATPPGTINAIFEAQTWNPSGALAQTSATVAGGAISGQRNAAAVITFNPASHSVPEPLSVSLLACGVFGLLLRTRRNGFPAHR